MDVKFGLQMIQCNWSKLDMYVCIGETYIYNEDSG